MATILLEYDTKNSIAEKGLEFLLSLGIFNLKEKSEKSSYNQKFVDKIKRSEKSEGIKIKTEDLWK